MQKIRKINIHLFKYLLLMCALFLGLAHASQPTPPMKDSIIDPQTIDANNNAQTTNPSRYPQKTSPLGVSYSAYPIVNEGEFTDISVQFSMDQGFLKSWDQTTNPDYLKISLSYSSVGNAELISEPIIIKFTDIEKKMVNGQYADTATLRFTLKGEGVFSVGIHYAPYDANHNPIHSNPPQDNHQPIIKISGKKLDDLVQAGTQNCNTVTHSATKKLE